MVNEVRNSPLQKQTVLPETANHMVNAQSYHLSLKHREELTAHDWVALEVRDESELPPINIFSTNKDILVENELIEYLIDRIKKITSLFGYEPQELDFLNIIVDSTNLRYKEAAALYNFIERNMWIKRQSGLGIDHELGHWATLSPINKEAPISDLLREGVATWASWHIKSDEEKTISPYEDYLKLSREVWGKTFSRESLRLNADYHNIPSMHLGGVLFDVLLDKYGGDTTKIGTAWKTTDQFQNVSEWIMSLGFSPKEIEDEWRERIFK